MKLTITRVGVTCLSFVKPIFHFSTDCEIYDAIHLFVNLMLFKWMQTKNDFDISVKKHEVNEIRIILKNEVSSFLIDR